MHVLRANYQAAIWRKCLQSQPSVPDPKECGWTTDQDGRLVIQWMRGSPAPEAALQLLSCQCVHSCKLPHCTCLSNGLKCTDMCRLQTCNNQPSEHDLHSIFTPSFFFFRSIFSHSQPTSRQAFCFQYLSPSHILHIL